MNMEQFIELIKKKEPVQVFGAGKFAKRLLEYCEHYGNSKKIACFIVSSMEGNPEEIQGIPVYVAGDARVDTGKEIWLVLNGQKIWNMAMNVLVEHGYERIRHISSKLMEKMTAQVAYETKTIDYVKRQDSRAYSRKGPFMENGFCDFCIPVQNEGSTAEYKWRFFYALLQSKIDNDEVFLPQGRILEACEEIYGPYRILSEEIKKTAGKRKDKNNRPVMRVYMTRCAADTYDIDAKIPEWLIPIQVGAALTSKRIYDVTDDMGDNISAMNPDYSECTALYWMWKNVHDADYLGLFHYSRHMNIPDDDIYAIADAGIDIVVTYPMLSGNVHDFFVPQHSPECDWRLMEESILRHYPEYGEDLKKYRDTFCYPGANLSIMRKEIFETYAEFCFTVMQDITDFYAERHFIREDRYAGYIMENLTALFVMHHKYRYKIAFTDFRYLKPY